MKTGVTFESTDCPEMNVTHERSGKRFFWVPSTGLLREYGRTDPSAYLPTKREVVIHVIARCAVYR